MADFENVESNLRWTDIDHWWSLSIDYLPGLKRRISPLNYTQLTFCFFNPFQSFPLSYLNRDLVRNKIFGLDIYFRFTDISKHQIFLLALCLIVRCRDFYWRRHIFVLVFGQTESTISVGFLVILQKCSFN